MNRTRSNVSNSHPPTPSPASDCDPARAWRLAELRAFLRARRGELRPALPTHGDRRTPGLRREEVALEAGVGVSWYTWLEQGRDIRISPQALARVARALRLTPADEAYLFWLADLPRQAPPAFGQVVASQIQSMLDSHSTPAIALDACFDIVGMNAMAADLYRFDAALEPFARNQMWQLLMNPAQRALYVDYEQELRHSVGVFRLSCVARVGAPRLQRMIDAMTRSSPAFRAIWEERRAEPIAPRPVRLRHPRFGDLSATTVRLPLPTDGGGLITFLEAEDSRTAAAFARWRGPQAQGFDSVSARAALD